MGAKSSFIYIGSGEAIPGIPARDVSYQEAVERGLVEKLEQSPLHRRASGEKKAKDNEKRASQGRD